jgi:hypothetical protein
MGDELILFAGEIQSLIHFLQKGGNDVVVAVFRSSIDLVLSARNSNSMSPKKLNNSFIS